MSCVWPVRTGKVESISGRASKVVEKMTDILNCKHAAISQSTGLIQEAVGSSLDGGITILGKILVLVKGLTVPVRDNQSTKNILDAITALRTSTIANKLVRISPFVDVIFNSVNTLLIRFDTVDVRNQRGPSDEKLYSLNTTLKIVSMATASLRRRTLHAGKRDF
jgi:hypothetical protein